MHGTNIGSRPDENQQFIDTIGHSELAMIFMDTSRDRVRRGIALGISLLMLTLSIAVPLMEQSELVNSPVVESEHNPAECPSGHDHTVCTQVGANLSVLVGNEAWPTTGSLVAIRAFGEFEDAASSAFEEGHPARAQPLA